MQPNAATGLPEALAEVPRKRLLADLGAVGPGGVVLVVAPAGCGKSTLLRQFVAADPRRRRLVSLRAGDGLAVLGSGELDELGGDVDLVVDDVQEMPAPTTGTVLRRLDDDWSGSGRLVLASRHRLPFVPALGRAGAEVHCVWERQLGFDAAELAVLAELTSERSVQHMVSRTGTWPAGTGLLRAAQSDRSNSVTRLLDQEVLDHLGDDELLFLASVAALVPARPDLVNAALNRDDVVEVLAELRDRGVPMIQLPVPRADVVMLPPLLRRLVIRRVRPSNGDYLHRVVDAGLERARLTGDLGLIFVLLEENDRRDEMADLCFHRAAQLALSGRVEALRAWLDRFDERERSTDPRLRLAAAHVIRPRREVAVREWLAPIRDDHGTVLPDGTSPAVAARRLLMAFGLEAVSEDDPAVGVLSPALRNRTAWQLYGRSRSAAARDLLERAPADPDEFPVAEAMRAAYLGILALEAGDVERARTHWSDGAALLRRHSLDRSDQAFLVDLVALKLARADRDLVAGDQTADAIIARMAMIGDGAKLERLSALVECAHHFVDRSLPRSTVRRLIGEGRAIVSSWTVPLERFETDLDRLEQRIDDMPMRSGYGARDPVLTAPELRVLRFLSSHLSVPEIAAALSLSVNTVKAHRSSIYRKLRVRTRAEAVEAAIERGFIARAPTTTPAAELGGADREARQIHPFRVI